MLNTPFSPWPSFTEEEADAVRRVLLSNKVNYWTGENGRAFESEFASWVGTKYAIALSNGTVALELALRSLGIGPGDEVVVTPRTYFASISCIVAVGANPVFADVDTNSQNITADSIREVLTERTRAVLCVHLAGWPCEMDPIMALAKKEHLFVIEDCAQAHGAQYLGNSVGAIGHIGAWSFCQDKILTTGGEGGMVTTNDSALWSWMWSYKDHGKSWDTVFKRKHAPGFRWLHENFGTNYRMTELQAVIGRIQLQRMADWHGQRITNAQRIWATARLTPGLRVPQVPHGIEHAAYKCYVFVEQEKLRPGWNRDRIINEIVARGVPCFSGSCSEVYLEKVFEDSNLRPARRLPVARELGDTSLMFLVHPTLSASEIEMTCTALDEVMNSAVL